METYKKKIVIIANFCDYGEEKTNNRFNYVANMLCEAGFDVEVVTSTFSHRQKIQRKVIDDGKTPYKTTLIYEPTYIKNISLKRFSCHKKWGKGVKSYLETISKPDLVYAAVPSLEGAYYASKYCEKNGVPFVIDVQDLWPEAYKMIFKVPIVNDCFFVPFKKLANKIYASADKVVAVSQTYADRALAVNDKTKDSCVVYLGTNLSVFEKNKTENQPTTQSDKFRLAYCGTLGASYDLTSVFDAMKILKDKGKDAQFIVMGTGPLLEKFKNYATSLGVDVVFTGMLPYEVMCAELCSCDLAINSITKGAAQSIINKVGDYAMANLPIISTQECKEFRNLVDEYQCGVNCESQSATSIANAIEKLMVDDDLRIQMGNNARVLAEERFNRITSYPKILKLIKETIKD